MAGRVLLGRRKDSGLYGLPGGWLEKYEDWNDCASRELREETGLCFSSSRFFSMETFNCKRQDCNYHAISLIMYSEIEDQEILQIKNMEPDKCEKWLWVSLQQLRNKINNLFYPLQDFLSKYPNIVSINELKQKTVKAKSFGIAEPIPIDKANKSPSKSFDSTFEEESIITKESLYYDYDI